MSLLNFFKKAVNKVVPETFDVRFADIIEKGHREFSKKETYYYGNLKIGDNQAYQQLLQLPGKEKVEFIIHTIKLVHSYNKGRHSWSSREKDNQLTQVAEAFMRQLLRSKLELDDLDLLVIFQHFIEYPYFGHSKSNPLMWPINLWVGQVEKQLKERKGTPELVEGLKELDRLLQTDLVGSVTKDAVKLRERVSSVIYECENASGSVRAVWFTGDDDFTPFANNIIQNQPAGDREHWFRLITHAQKATAGTPSKKYLDEAKNLIGSLGEDKFRNIVNEWFEFIVALKDKVTEYPVTYGGREQIVTNTIFLATENIDTIKGFVWMYSFFNDKHALYIIGNLAGRAYRKIQWKGPAAVAVGNACVYVLANSKGLEGISFLSRLRLRIQQSGIQNLIEKYLNQAAKSHGVSVHEIEDMAVDDYGLQNGERTFMFDDYKGVVRITGVGKTETSWYKPDGSLQKSVPAFVKEKHAASLKKMKEAVKQIEETSSSQRDRIDRMFKSTRTLSWQQFNEYYRDHGLMRFITEKLVWVFDNGACREAVIHLDGNWVNPSGILSFTPDDTTKVSLWHPVFSTVSEIKDWRDFLADKKIIQPVKQAHREVYLLTEAEITTRTYSNRMAAHLLKQHQFNSLAKVRGWKYTLMGNFDGGYGNGASLSLPEYGLTVEYWVNEVNAENAINDTGIWLYLATDQVRFIKTGTSELVELFEVPAVVFSEVMRDVDLFVGVSSVGNDPAWRDTGGLPQYNDYWQSYSFGELNELAKTRKQVLERLLPRLKIAKVAGIKDKFLVVKGHLRTYKIHIGSTNILMEPNDQYLCIVPDRGAKNVTENLFLPFEGDNGVSVIISKAFLLAEDDKIKDSTITSQIKRK